MKKFKHILWYFPLCFFVFMAIYISVKFIFIFFFHAPYEPEFMFNLTPYYILSGVNNLHSLLLSIIVIIFNVFLHVNVSKRNFLLSFLPTGVMLAGLGFKIATREIVISNFFHYLIFGYLLIITLMDHKHILIFPDSISIIEKETVKIKTALEKSTNARTLPKAKKVSVIDNHMLIEDIDKRLILHNEMISDLRLLIKGNLHQVKAMVAGLEKKTKKLDRIEEEIEGGRKILVEQEKLLRNRFVSSLDKRIQVKPINGNDQLTFNIENGREIRDHHGILDKIPECAAILRRGILKQVNRPFVELLGYSMEDLVEKSLLDFIDSEGLSGIEIYFLNRLKGRSVSSYKTMLLTGDNRRIQVEVSIKQVSYNGEKVDIAVFRNLNHVEQENDSNQ